jgi:hypothetical protein
MHKARFSILPSPPDLPVRVRSSIAHLSYFQHNRQRRLNRYRLQTLAGLNIRRVRPSAGPLAAKNALPTSGKLDTFRPIPPHADNFSGRNPGPRVPSVRSSSPARDEGVSMKKSFLGSFATLLSSVGLALGQFPQPPPPPPPGEAAQPAATEATAPAPAPAAAAENAAPAPGSESPPVDRRPWNPSLKQGIQWPYPESPHNWLSGLCPDLEEFWLSADYLLWAMRAERLPALVTTSPPNSLGILGQPGTSVLIGNTDVNQGAFSGGHFAGGVWLDDDHSFGFEGTYFFLAEQSRTFSVASSGGANSPTLARPFFNVLTGLEDAELLALPGQQAAGITVAATTYLEGAEATGVVGLCGGGHYCLEMLIGFRYLDLKEELNIGQHTTFLPNAPVNAGGEIDQADQFATRNHLYAGQLGLRAEACWNGLLLGLVGKLAMGANEETVNIAGVSRFAPASGTALVSPGGLLAVPTNSGHFTRSPFAVVPELGVQLGYQLSRHVRFFAGYTFLYWSTVVRPGNQIDRVLNPMQVPVVGPPGLLTGPARPAFSFHESDFWAQGGNFGLEFRY